MTLPKLTPDNFINRELSSIQFQRRVLELAAEDGIPLLERIKFLAIVGDNLDEFFMVRVASYIQKIQMGITRTRPDGYTPQQLVQSIREELTALYVEQRHIKKALLEQLDAQGVSILNISDLTPAQYTAVREYFREAVFPVLTPLAVDEARPFPFISNLSLNLAIFLERDGDEDKDDAEMAFARLKVPVPDILPRLINLNDVMARHGNAGDTSSAASATRTQGQRYLWIEDVIKEHLNDLFSGMHVKEAYPFRVVRNADIDYEQEREHENGNNRDFMSLIEASVRERRFGSVVRVSVPDSISQHMLDRLRHGLQVRDENDIYFIEGALGTANLMELASADRPDLKYDPFVPRLSDQFIQAENIFDLIRQQDILLHHPYDSFSPVEDFFRTAASDPQVLAIKATLYRVGKNSPIVQALMDARENDKQVTVLVELKARFDEENNLEWSRALESKGVHVIYGVEELPIKTHSKVALVVRREGSSVRRYLHLGTGNYNASTARLYTDLGLMTSNPQLADDATRLFNRLTGYAPDTTYERLLVAPEYLLNAFLRLIDNEIEAAKAGKDARLVFKMNQLEEDRIIQRLYAASQAGVQVDLIVRGLCCLRPGIPGISENIRVVSIVGRFLEHSRIYYFQNAPRDQQYYLGSADMMRRNLYNRVETVFPVLDEALRKKLRRFLATSLRDNSGGAWELKQDGRYHRRRDAADTGDAVRSQAALMRDSFGLHIDL